MEPTIQLKNVSYRYPNMDHDVVEELNIDFFSNQFIAILGPNGSGKSTLAKLLNGILLPRNGVIIVDHIETSEDDEQIWHIRKQIGVVFQNPDNQIVANTVEEDVAFGLENQGVDPGEIRRRVDDALTQVGLSSYTLFEPHHLSGGQKQKVAIAGILAMKPKVIVFDEATSMLDPRGRKEVINTVKHLTKTEDITVIHITHILQETLSADRIIIMNEGKILLDGPVKEILKERDVLIDVGLDVPIAVELAYRLKNKGYPFSDEIIFEEEFIQELWTFL